jgi:hypothetical protein
VTGWSFPPTGDIEPGVPIAVTPFPIFLDGSLHVAWWTGDSDDMHALTVLAPQQAADFAGALLELAIHADAANDIQGYPPTP